MPPLVVVFGISLVYAGILVSVLWCIQIFTKADLWLAVLPFNCILLAILQIQNLICQWNQLQQQERRTFKNSFLQACDRKLQQSQTWPAAAVLVLLPVLAVLLIVLVLLGQSPDALIQAFTQTSDWNLSTRTSPPNVYVDGHYLCTVAAGGHQALVKPLREGERHGHPVIVNRQLCVANAFEQLLEEHTPRFHRALRKFYDTYGFPIAKLIRTKWAADVVYLLMKPLEWMFLLVLYAWDVKPEDRIARQYLPAEIREALAK